MAWKLLLGSNSGLAALAVIVATVVIGYGFLAFFGQMAKKDAAANASK